MELCFLTLGGPEAMENEEAITAEAIVWNTIKEELEYKFEIESLCTSSQVAWQSDDTFAVARNDKSIALLNVVNSKAGLILIGHTDYIKLLKWDSKGQLLASCSRDKTVKVWNMRSNMCLRGWQNNYHIDDIRKISWLYNTIYGSTVLASFSYYEIKIWAATGSCLVAHRLEPQHVFGVSASGRFFMSAKNGNNCNAN